MPSCHKVTPRLARHPECARHVRAAPSRTEAAAAPSRPPAAPAGRPFITTHVLDTAAGRPAAHVEVQLHMHAPGSGLEEPGTGEGAMWLFLANSHTGADGRCTDLLPVGYSVGGVYRCAAAPWHMQALSQHCDKKTVHVTCTCCCPAEPLLCSPARAACSLFVISDCVFWYHEAQSTSSRAAHNARLGISLLIGSLLPLECPDMWPPYRQADVADGALPGVRHSEWRASGVGTGGEAAHRRALLLTGIRYVQGGARAALPCAADLEPFRVQHLPRQLRRLCHAVSRLLRLLWGILQDLAGQLAAVLCFVCISGICIPSLQGEACVVSTVCTSL